MSADPFQTQSRGDYAANTSSMSPQSDQAGDTLTNPSGSEQGQGSKKNSLTLGLDFLKGLGHSDKKANRDGQPSKRRGPKPDSKPALTRRQELNRQAQRTHRERKEGYIKSLEEQVMQLREVYTGSVQEKNAVADENKKLKDLLRMHGIAYNSRDQTTQPGFPSINPGSSSASQSAGYVYGQGQGFTSPPNALPSNRSAGTSPGTFGSSEVFGEQPSLRQQTRNQQRQGGLLDYDQLGVDFVLALEAACMDHLQYMCVRSNQDPEPTPSGHAMMMTCPTFSHIDNLPEVPYPHKMNDLPNTDLMHLLTLSQDLPLDGELTPVMALNMIRNHPRFKELTLEDFEAIKEELKTKTRCYGFGAVLEEFELKDALSSVFARKLESYAVFQ